MDNARNGIDRIGVSVGALLHDGHGKLMLQQRGPKARDERGRWDLCGGAVEFGDTIEDTIRRELKEELNLVPKSMEFLVAYDSHRVSDKDEKMHWVTIIYAVQIDPSKVKINEPDKIAETRWFTADTLPNPLHSQFFKSFDVAVARGIIN